MSCVFSVNKQKFNQFTLYYSVYCTFSISIQSKSTQKHANYTINSQHDYDIYTQTDCTDYHSTAPYNIVITNLI